MDDMVEVGKFERVAEKENRRIVAHQIPVALFGVEFKHKTADIPLGICCAALAGHGGKARKHLGFLADPGKYLGAGVFGYVVGNGEVSIGA